MEWISELTKAQWTYILINVLRIIGILYAAFSSMLDSDKTILNKSYNILPDIKVYGLQKEKIILNAPMDLVYENLKENTSLFLGFLVSVAGFFCDAVLETERIKGAHLLILAMPISIICYLIMYVLTKIISNIRYYIIYCRIKNNKIMPDSYTVFETDNVEHQDNCIHSEKKIRECSWERTVVNGDVKDKIKK